MTEPLATLRGEREGTRARQLHREFGPDMLACPKRPNGSDQLKADQLKPVGLNLARGH
jgi:hypothetical protein